MENPSTSREPLAGETVHAQPDLQEVQAPQLSRWRRMQIPVIAWAAYWLVRLLGPTLRVEIVGVQNAIQIRDKGEPGIGVFWHRCIFTAIWIWRDRDVVVLNTVNFDGQWTRRAIERLGFRTVQGSSTRGAIQGLTDLAKQLESGRHVALTIDGPRGPRYVAKPGAVILARRTGRAISPFHISLRRAFTFRKAWDLFQLPCPFTRAVMFCAPPILLPADAGNATLHQAQAEVQAALEKVRDVADSWFDLAENERELLREDWSQRGSCGGLMARNAESEPLPSDGPRDSESQNDVAG